MRKRNGSRALGARLEVIPQEILAELRPALVKGAEEIGLAIAASAVGLKDNTKRHF